MKTNGDGACQIFEKDLILRNCPRERDMENIFGVMAWNGKQIDVMA